MRRECKLVEDPVFLKNRGVVRVAGSEAEDFLQGLITNDIRKLGEDKLLYAALLSPQGKVLFDFIIQHSQGVFFLDVNVENLLSLIQRLQFYILRARVEVSDVTSDFGVVVGGSGLPLDPRMPQLGSRGIMARTQALTYSGAEAVYEARRIACLVPKGGVDFDYGDIFPHDINMDLLNGLDFRKGCYVGQEVVARMQHRANLRKRIVKVHLEGTVPPPRTPICDGDLTIGTLGSAVGQEALALLRTDRVQEALRASRPLFAETTHVTIISTIE